MQFFLNNECIKKFSTTYRLITTIYWTFALNECKYIGKFIPAGMNQYFILTWHTFLTFFRVAHRLWRWNSASIHDLKISQNNGNLRPWSIIISYWGSITNSSHLCKARTPIWYGRRLQNWPMSQWFD